MALGYWDRAYAQLVYQYLLGQTNNVLGTCALMGNLFAESSICPFRCQGMTYAQSQTQTDVFNQNNETYFVNFSTYGGGYSLAQWTTHDRKRKYYRFVGAGYVGDGYKSLYYLPIELQNDYVSCWNKIINCTDINDCTIYLLKRYEAPSDTGPAVQRLRCSYARSVYDDFSGLPPLPPAPIVPIWELFNFDQRKKHPLPIDPNMII